MITVQASIHLTNILMNEKLKGRSVGSKYRQLQRCKIIDRGDKTAERVLETVLDYKPISEIKNHRIAVKLMRGR